MEASAGGDSATSDGSIQRAAEVAIEQIERWEVITRAVSTLFRGLSLASILLLMALGLAITFGLMGVINMAHGELMMLGAYSAFVMQGWFQTYLPANLFNYYFLLAIPFSFLVAGAICGALPRPGGLVEGRCATSVRTSFSRSSTIPWESRWPQVFSIRHSDCF